MCTISLCMIVRNEEHTLKQCLESVYKLCDEIIVVDTGSTDDTKKVASSFTPLVYDFQWIDDFSAARNFAFAQATSDYILWLDADDVLLKADHDKLARLKEELLENVDAVTMIYHYAFDEFGNVTTSLRRNRLVKRDKNFRWVGPVHEYLGVNGQIINSDIVVTHTRKHAHSGRNLAIFENREKRGESFSPRDLYYFGNELMDNQHFDKALKIYARFIEEKKGWSEDIISACYRLSEIYMMKEEYDKACTFAMHSFEYDLPRAEICCRLGSIFLKQKNYEQACYWFKLATELDKPIEHLGFLQEACWTWFPHLQLCICYYQIGEFEKSYKHNEQALKYRPTDEHMLYNKKLLQEKNRVEVKI
ncbi:glycosyltransferase [Fictibacillus phosphorivorans]|uniref:glycosyltransferase n=1 Tax=Fictibacillus phosphorivorans TaxID=1221500 RepID=UPI001292F5BE|nr:glycosyltransferase [Fictibacillus phosphorivorans]MQR94337.1 glycosyltransferase [Fictibacillus phosphorivorans]